jgi:hypothetical protein
MEKSGERKVVQREVRFLRKLLGMNRNSKRITVGSLASENSYTCRDKKRRFADAEIAVKNVFKNLINDEFVNDEPDTKTRIAYRCAPN